MMFPRYVLRIFPRVNLNNLLIALISIIAYHFIFQHKLPAAFFSTTDMKQDETESVNPRASSVWCRGEMLSKRLCRFQNLCIHSDGEFIFFHGPESIISGITLPQMKEAIVELSSIEGHNALTLVLTDVPVDRIGDLPWTIKDIEDTSFLLKRFKPNNLMHVIHDDLMPIYSSLLEIGACPQEKRCNAKLVFVDSFARGPFWDFYKLFTQSEPILLSDLSSKEIYCFKDVYVGLNRNTVWYQYGFTEPQSPWVNRTVTAMDIQRFTSYVTSFLAGRLLPSTCPAIPLTVLLSRKNTRLILNERQVTEMIEQQTITTVITLSLDDHSLVDLIAHIQCAKILIGMHGALLVLSAFLPPGSILIELFPYAVPPEDYTPYKTLATLPGMGITYKEWVNTKEEHTVIHPDWPKLMGGINHLPLEEQQRIMRDKPVKRHLCCSDPQWLLRIFQDTFVDIASLSDLIRVAMAENEDGSKLAVASKIEDLWTRNLFPGRVNNLNCQVNDDYIDLLWDPPWNLDFLHFVEWTYEVWFRVFGDPQYKIAVTNATVQRIERFSLPIDVWVTTKVSGEKRGPFQWFVCKES
uniref:Glycosyltransferase 61 catalytic domain-containing protein n=1 Tax=Strigamia maritima TaxID=126957 RepID=T1IYY5_STRMM